MKKYLYQLATDQSNGPLDQILKFFLWMLSLIYGLAVFVVKSMTRVTHLPKPVISVGNLTMGGVGKTPLVEFIAEYILLNPNFANAKSGLKQLKPAILTRGYIPSALQSKMSESDEVAMLKKKFPQVPIVAGPNRAQRAQDFLKENAADIFILDDGFQQWGLFRNLNILTVDATNPWGNGHLIPRGILREPLSSIKQADIIVLTKTDLGRKNMAALKQVIRNFNASVPIVEAVHKPVKFTDPLSEQTFDLSFIKNQKICFFCGIGDPLSLEEMLKNLGAHVAKSFIFEDHHVYSAQEISVIHEYCQRQAIGIIVTTDKDAVKLKNLLSGQDKRITFLSLSIVLSIVEGKEVLFERINSLSRH